MVNLLFLVPAFVLAVTAFVSEVLRFGTPQSILDVIRKVTLPNLWSGPRLQPLI